MAVTLCIRGGQDDGRSLVVEPGHCVMIGRAFDNMTETDIVGNYLTRALAEEDQRIVADHVAARATQGRHVARVTFFGFERDPDVELVDEAVSHTHAVVFVDDTSASIVDIASTNGCFLNGSRVHASELHAGDLLRMGATRIEVLASSTSAQ